MGCGSSTPQANPGRGLAEAKNEARPATLAKSATQFESIESSINDVLAWMKLTPPVESTCGQAMGKCFPGALPAIALVQRADYVLHAFDPEGFTAEKVLHGQSLCPDEINHEKYGLASRMTEHWGEVFPMGGIGGAPYVGKTGFGAFSHHVPDDGHVFILFGPHIAVSESGELGKCLRLGQAHESGACGAVLAAYGACKAGEVKAGEMDPLDMQQTWLRQKVHGCFHEIEASDNPMLTLIHKAYKMVEENMLSIVNHNYGNGKLILLGGIQINMPRPYEDHFLPLMFQVSSKANPDPINLLPRLYQNKD